MSEIMNIYQKLVEVRKTVSYLQKQDKGGQYEYVGSSDVLASVRSKMDELSILLIPSVISHKVSESTVEYIEKGKYGDKPKKTTTYFTELDICMKWVNAEKPDEFIDVPWYGQGVDIAGEKGVGKALTYAEKYFILKSFNIATDKDDPDAFQEKHDLDKEDKKPQPTEQPKPTGEPVIEKISEPQAKRLFALAKANQEIVKQVLAKYKYVNSIDISKADYNKIAAEIEKLAS